MDDWLEDTKAEKREKRTRKYNVTHDWTYQHFWNPSKQYKKWLTKKRSLQ